MKWRTLLPDTFVDVQALTEEEAMRLACEQLTKRLKPEDFIAWREEDSPLKNTKITG